MAVYQHSAAVDSLGIGPGDEVIMPTFTIISCITQIVRCGAIPVLVDSDSVTWNMDVTQIEAKITPRTKAIMVVHIYGLPVDMSPVLDIAKRYKLKIIDSNIFLLSL
jgi:perosamine synthetase